MWRNIGRGSITCMQKKINKNENATRKRWWRVHRHQVVKSSTRSTSSKSARNIRQLQPSEIREWGSRFTRRILSLWMKGNCTSRASFVYVRARADEFNGRKARARVSVKKKSVFGGREKKRVPTLRTANCRRWCAGWDEQDCESLISLCGLPLFNRSRELWRWFWIIHSRDESLFRKYTFQKKFGAGGVGPQKLHIYGYGVE